MPASVPVSMTVYILPAESVTLAVLTTVLMLDGSPALITKLPAPTEANALACKDVTEVAMLVVPTDTFSDNASEDKLMNLIFALPEVGAERSSVVTSVEEPVMSPATKTE